MCFIFVLIGAPMGAIIRKGGYGYPLLVSIIFFMVYIILFIFTRQVAKSQTMDAIIAAWLPDIVMFPIGLYLTSMANRDRKFSGLISVGMLFKGLFKRSKS
jgi:lipopolysaccharide export system permease protein